MAAALVRGRAFDPEVAAGQRDVLDGAQLGEHLAELEDHPHAGQAQVVARHRAQLRQILAFHEHFAR